MDTKDLREIYPEIERPLRLDGSPESQKKCLKPVIENLDTILNVIHEIAEYKKLEYENAFIFQSRAIGTCKEKSDIDIYVQLNDKHRNTVKTKGTKYKDSGVILLVGEWALKFFSDIPKHIMNILVELRIDIFWGVEPTPPAKHEYRGIKYYIKLEELRDI